MTHRSHPSFARVLAFRFGFSFAVLFAFPFPIGAIPGTDWGSNLVQRGWDFAVAAAAHVLHRGPVSTEFSGSGDRLYDWISLGLSLVLAGAAAAVWSALDRRTRSYPRLEEGLRVLLRYVLGAAMISYGVAKVTRGQFPDATPIRLLEPFGQFSPMGLLWTFMGYSAPYCIFTGAIELLGGLLLFFRRTVTLGALLLVGVMGHVVMLNLCFDVPVKLYSTTLWLFAVWLAARHARPLFDFLVRHRRASFGERRLPLDTPLRVWARRLVKAGFLAALALSAVQGQRQATPAVYAPIAGFYEVEAFEQAGVADASKTRWRFVNVAPFGYFQAHRADGTWVGTFLQVGPAGAWTLANAEMKVKVKVKATQPDPSRWLLQGEIDGQPAVVRLHRTAPPPSPLLTRGFHWVTETPFNR